MHLDDVSQHMATNEINERLFVLRCNMHFRCQAFRAQVAINDVDAAVLRARCTGPSLGPSLDAPAVGTPKESMMDKPRPARVRPAPDSHHHFDLQPTALQTLSTKLTDRSDAGPHSDANHARR